MIHAKLSDSDTNTSDQIKISRDTSGKLIVASAAVTATSVSLIATMPAHAEDAAAAVNTMVTSLSTIATAALAVALVPMTISFAFRIVKRVMSF